MTQPARDSVIRIRGLRTGFGNTLIHDGLDLDVHRGEVLGIVGGSGTGKSVLLRTIVGLLPFRSGTIEVLGREISSVDARERRRLGRRLGVLFQQGALFSSLTVRQNIQVPMREHLGMPLRLMAELADLKISMVGLPPEAGDKFPSELSGGMIKRASLARALALDPDIVFLDEPTSGLDPIGAAAFDELIQELQLTMGLTVFMVTHDIDSLYTVCDRIAALAEKKVLLAGPVETLRASDHPWLRSYFHNRRAERRGV